MKADPADQEKLLELQALDLHLAQLRSRLANLAERRESEQLQSQLQSERQVVRERLAVVDELRAELARAESDVQLVQSRLARDTERVDQTSSAKDAQGLTHEIDTLRERLSVLEEVQLEVMERLEAAEADLQESERAAADTEAALNEALSSVQARESQLAQESAAMESERSQLAATVPAELFALYERVRERYGQGASLLRAGISEASGVRLTESDLNDIRRAAPDDVVMCPDSNAILVRTRESGLS